MKSPHVLTALIIFVLATGALGCATAEAAEPEHDSYVLLPDPHGVVLKTPAGDTVFRYMTKKPRRTNLAANSVCCFHPLNTPSGERVTDMAPGDHHHHRGVFLAWHTAEFWEEADFSAFGPTGPTHGWEIHRGDFWGWGQYAPTDEVVIENRDVKLVESDTEHAEILIQNAWMIHGKTMMDELNSVVVRRQGVAYVVDLDYRFMPVFDLVLNETSFGGFCVRTRQDGDSYYSTKEGKVDLPDPHYSAPDLNWPATDWSDFTIKTHGDRTVGVTVINHPKNPSSTWHNPRYVWMINPTIVDRGPVKVKAGAVLALRYRLVVHDGAPPVELLEELTAEWKKQ